MGLFIPEILTVEEVRNHKRTVLLQLAIFRLIESKSLTGNERHVF